MENIKGPPQLPETADALDVEILQKLVAQEELARAKLHLLENELKNVQTELARHNEKLKEKYLLGKDDGINTKYEIIRKK